MPNEPAAASSYPANPFDDSAPDVPTEDVLAEIERYERKAAASTAPRPNFKECGNCGADAATYCSWDPADGWCCSKCGGCDSDE